MANVQTIIAVLFCVIKPSFEVVINPCNVDNILTQPHFGTSLAKKELVQIVQIPPVFTQNVVVGICVNATDGSLSTPGSYFVCKQRYSSVEVYILDNHPDTNANYSAGIQLSNSIVDNFKTGVFVRDYVAVASGCDFTFNLLPLLLRQDSKPAEDTEQKQNYHFLKSPYHSELPSKYPKAITTSGISGSGSGTTTEPKKTSKFTHPALQFLPVASPLTATATPSPIQTQIPATTAKPNVYVKGGNVYANSGIGSLILGKRTTTPTPTTTENIYHIYSPLESTIGKGDSSQSSGYKIPKVDNIYYTGDSYESFQDKKQTFVASTRHDQELYGLSDKVGVPLYILSSKVDPLLNNINRTNNYYTQ